ncbi:MAG: CRISPR system precrRNA processing endoribonuclease RAMP protein Cas6 [Nitrosomonas sp. PRO4]|nr:CRISPR system precrRNA processing endoribonuclease RAMP protein Cas6 [Nitrosomonas sp. PRO4]
MIAINNPSIPLGSYRFYFDTDHSVRLPDYPGSAWRGAFGHALKRTVCVVRNTPCQQCLLKQACAYSYIFETPPPAGTKKMRKYTATPHPFVFRFTAAKSSTQEFSFDMNLFGHGQRFFPYIVHAMCMAGQDGVGGNRQPFRLSRVDAIDFQGQPITVYQEAELRSQPPLQSPPLPEMPEKINIIFHSPVRIKQDNKNLAAGHFSFGALFGSLLRRISMISYFHTDVPLETDFASLTAAARNVQFSAQNLHWYDWTRYSSRQKTEMQMGGLLGSISLNMQGLEDFWPYLWLGQWTHVGKGTSMGMGAYTIEPASLPDVQSVNQAAILTQ